MVNLRRRMVVLLLFVSASSIFAATLTVKADGSGTYKSIQAACNAARSGDVILLKDGVFKGKGNFNIKVNKKITIRSKSGNRDKVIVNPEGRASDYRVGFIIGDGSSLATKIENITIKNGAAADA